MDPIIGALVLPFKADRPFEKGTIYRGVFKTLISVSHLHIKCKTVKLDGSAHAIKVYDLSRNDDLR